MSAGDQTYKSAITDRNVVVLELTMKISLDTCVCVWIHRRNKLLRTATRNRFSDEESAREHIASA
jgi:hypothetical protein